MGTSKRMRQKAGRQARLEAAKRAQQRARRNRTVRNVGIVVVVLVIALLAFSQLGGDDATVDASATTTFPTFPTTTSSLVPAVATYGTGPCPAADGSSPPQIDFTEAPMQCIDLTKTYTAVFKTSEGDITVELDPSLAPVAVNDFVVLARYHYYDATKIFRTNTLIQIIQGGSPHTQDNSDPGAGFPINDEGGIFDWTLGIGPFSYEKGDLVLARSPVPNGSGPQFFFGAGDNVADLTAQGTYIKLGSTTEGLDVLEKILALHAPGPEAADEGAPSKDVTILTVQIIES
jgi:cyclophilin family peptidyl-prolyl cis-trans isomerase